MVDRDPIEQKVAEWRAMAEIEAGIDDCEASRSEVLRMCADELDALLGSARLQKERKGEELNTHVDMQTQSDLGATGGKNELASAQKTLCRCPPTECFLHPSLYTCGMRGDAPVLKGGPRDK